MKQTFWTDDLIVYAIQLWAKQHNGVPPSHDDWKRAGENNPNNWTVKQLFGSWNAAIHAAGFTPNAKGGRLRPDPQFKIAVGEQVVPAAVARVPRPAVRHLVAAPESEPEPEPAVVVSHQLHPALLALVEHIPLGGAAPWAFAERDRFLAAFIAWLDFACPPTGAPAPAVKVTPLYARQVCQRLVDLLAWRVWCVQCWEDRWEYATYALAVEEEPLIEVPESFVIRRPRP